MLIRIVKDVSKFMQKEYSDAADLELHEDKQHSANARWSGECFCELPASTTRLSIGLSSMKTIHAYVDATRGAQFEYNNKMNALHIS